MCSLFVWQKWDKDREENKSHLHASTHARTHAYIKKRSKIKPESEPEYARILTILRTCEDVCYCLCFVGKNMTLNYMPWAHTHTYTHASHRDLASQNTSYATNKQTKIYAYQIGNWWNVILLIAQILTITKFQSSNKT